MKTRTIYNYIPVAGEVFNDEENKTIPGRVRSMSELIARFASGTSSGSIVHNVEYDDSPNLDEPFSAIDSPDFSICDLPAVESEIQNKTKSKKSKTAKQDDITTTTNDDE